MKENPVPSLLSRAVGCYLCWAISGVIFGAISASLEPGGLKSVLKILAAVLLLGGGIAMALDQDRIRREHEKERGDSEN